MKRCLRQRGFTLLELMVAVAVLAVMGAIAYSGLGALARNAGATAEAADRFGRVTRAMALLERDLRGAVPRASRDLLGDLVPPLVGRAETISLTRGGWDNPLDQARATLQRVTWTRRDGTLVRIAWPVLDLAQGTDPIIQDLLDGVDEVSLEFLPERAAEWIGVWPPPTPLEAGVMPWPAAVRIVLDIDGFGRIERIFGLVGEPT